MFSFPIRRRQNGRPTTRRPHARYRRLLLEGLEGRQLLATFTVTINHGSGPKSLPAEIALSNASSGTATNTIDFAITSGESDTISLSAALPPITHPVIINGMSQPGTGTAPRIVIRGSAGSGFMFDKQASNSTLKGLAIVDFPSNGVVLNGSDGVTVTDDYIGVTPSGTAAGNHADGVFVEKDALDNTITGNVISGNGASGVAIESGAAKTVLTGNLIGTNLLGTVAMPNDKAGVFISGSSNNTIGGTASGTSNTISGNTGDGVDFQDGADANLVEANFIGNNSAATPGLHNGDSGVLIELSQHNTIGGSTSGAGNTISDNKADGVQFEDSADSNMVQGNFIGTNVSGAKNLGNFSAGVSISVNSGSNTIGGTTPVGATTNAARNIISGNLGDGVDINMGSNNNVVEGDFIGIDGSGKVIVPNDGEGVLIENASNENTIGGTASGAGNTISGNDEVGVKLTNQSASSGGMNDNVVEGNFIGTDPTGTSALKNKSDGVVIDYGSDGNTIGGTSAAASNVISGNGGSGVVLSTGKAGQSVNNNVVDGNFIGTTQSGDLALGNTHYGVYISGSSHNTVGGTATGAGNTIAANSMGGVCITGSSIDNKTIKSTDNTVDGNDIGTNAKGKTGLGNNGDGVYIEDSSAGNTIGGSAAVAGNTIEDNTASGVGFYQVGKNNAVEYDVISSNGPAKTTSDHDDGILVNDSSNAISVSYTTIESNDGWGIYLESSGDTIPSGPGNTISSTTNKLGAVGHN